MKSVQRRPPDRGLSYLNEIGSKLLSEQLPRLTLPNINHHLPGDQGIIQLSRIRISRFRRASTQNVTAVAPNRLRWTMQDLDIGLIGALSGNVSIVVPFELTGEAEVLAEGLDFTLEAAIDKSAEGTGLVSTLRCSTSIKSVEVINHNGGLFGLAVTVFKMSISDNVRTMLQGLICKKVRKYIDEDLNRKLSEVQTKSSLAEAIEMNALRGEENEMRLGKLRFLQHFSKEFANDFFIDYRLKEAPICYDDNVELTSVGEISFLGRGETPFGAPLLEWTTDEPPRQDGGAMLQLLISDYIPNSLLFHAFKRRLTRIRMDRNSEGIGDFFDTTCKADTVCVSDLIPKLGEKFPNSSIEIVFSATRAPAMLFTPKNNGVIAINVEGVVLLYVMRDGGARRQVAVFDLDMVADVSVHVNRSRLRGSVRLAKFELLSRFGALFISQDELSDIALLSSEMLERMINEFLAKGLPIPVPKVLRLENVSLSVRNRRLSVHTDFVVDERKLRTIAQQTIFQDLPFGSLLRLF